MLYIYIYIYCGPCCPKNTFKDVQKLCNLKYKVDLIPFPIFVDLQIIPFYLLTFGVNLSRMNEMHSHRKSTLDKHYRDTINKRQSHVLRFTLQFFKGTVSFLMMVRKEKEDSS